MRKIPSPSAVIALSVAILASVLVLAAATAWERNGVRVYELSPAESLLLPRAGDLVGPSVELGASVFEERTEKRIEGFDRAVLEYEFAAEESGVNVSVQLIESSDPAGAEAEVSRLFQEARTILVAPTASIPGSTNPDDLVHYGSFRRTDSEVRALRQGTYVYVVELSDAAGMSPGFETILYERIRSLDQAGYVLPRRSPTIP